MAVLWVVLALPWLVAMTGSGGAAPLERQVEAPGPAGPLRGTLLDPANPAAPLVLIIPGSGPVDRDGNDGFGDGFGLRAATYRLLAEGLAGRGIASVRIDKRGLFGSRAAVADGNAVTIADYVTDIRSWMTSLRQQTGRRCLWLLGHSEGGLVALAAANAAAADLCGVIVVATAGQPIGAVLRRQLQANPANGPVLSAAFAAIAALESGQPVDAAGLPPALSGLFHPAIQSFLIDEMRYDPAVLAAAVAVPLLIVQGQRDLQVDTDDARRLHQAQPAARLVLVPDANHVLKSVPADDRAANLAAYGDPARPLAAGVVAALARFIAGSAGDTR